MSGGCRKSIASRLGLNHLFAALFLVLSTSAWSATFALFDQKTGEQVKDFDAIVSHLSPGDKISFTNGKTFKIGKLLGTGYTTLIYEIAGEPGQAIRLPKKSGYFLPDMSLSYADLITHFNEGSKQLVKLGVPSVGVRDALNGQYVVVDRLKSPMTAGQFFFDRSLSDRTRAEMSKKFVEFAQTTARLESIGDFHQDQLVYDATQKRWILLDWTDSHSELRLSKKTVPEKSPSVFVRRASDVGGRFDFFADYLTRLDDRWIPKDKRYEWIATLANQSEQAIIAERVRILQPQSGKAAPKSVKSCASSYLQLLK